MAQETISGSSVLNLGEALGNLDGDVELLEEIVGIFMETADEQIRSITDAIRTGNLQKVAIESHAMKGGASNFCAGDFVKSALALELLAKRGTLEGAWELLEKMTAELGDLREVVQVINWREIAAQWVS